jgi:hypothetical protein
MRKRSLSVARQVVILGCLSVLGAGPMLAAAQYSTDIRVDELPSPAPPQSELSRVTSDELGNLYLSWVTRSDSWAQLSYAQWIDDAWSEPQSISEGDDWFVNWADFPMLSLRSHTGVAHWLQKSGMGSYDYDVVASFFDHAQRRWGQGQVVNRSGIAAEHGFVSMLPMEKQLTLITWLDGRNTRNQPEPGPMTLRAAVFDSSGNNLNEWELDPATCDCCQTSSAMTAAGPVVVYRDRSANDVRDTAIVRLIDGNWTQPELVHQDDWQVLGCPVNGPAVAARDDDVAVAWFTARNDSPKVQLALSSNSGASFAPPIQVAGPNTNGRVDTVILANGEVVVSWLETEAAQARIMLSRFAKTGQFIDSVDVAETSASRRSGFPIIESVEDTVYVSWTDVSGIPRIRVARVSFPSEAAD